MSNSNSYRYVGVRMQNLYDVQVVYCMKGDQDKRKKFLAMGHGELRDLQDEKEFFAEMKGENMMVVHFYRNNWPCKVMDMHLDLLSKVRIYHVPPP